MLSRSEPQREIEIATSKLTTMFLNFGKFEPQCSYKHGSYKKKKVYEMKFIFSKFHFCDVKMPKKKFEPHLKTYK